MNSLLNQLTGSPNSQSNTMLGMKRKFTEENVEVFTKKSRKVQEEEDPDLFSFMRNLFSFVFPMFEKNENQNTIIDKQDTTDDFRIHSETEKNTNQDNSLLLQYERILIYHNDMDCLEEKKFLNDKIIDLVLSILKNNNGYNQTYVSNSFFFTKLRNIQDPKKYYKETSRWFKNGVLSNKKTWIIPVCENFHWYIVAVNDPETSSPQIFVMDSWKKSHYDSVDIVKEFLNQKFNAEHGEDIESIGVKIIDIPQQNNSYDCGLHAIRSAELFMGGFSPYYISLISERKSPITSDHEIYDIIRPFTRNEIVRYIKRA